MKGRMKIASVRDVPINIHWTFLLLVGLIAFALYAVTADVRLTLYAVGVLLVIFFIVLMHELAHVAVARHYGVPTREITLHPLGGISMMERMPEKPKEEARVAAAGPMVNLGLAVLLVPFVWHFHGPDALYQLRLVRLDQISIFQDLYWINIIMGVFNLLPAFPLDGGRVMRASLATKLNYVRATKAAADMGRFFGILFVLGGFFWPNIFLLLIGVFVYFGASAEERSATTMAVFSKARVGDAMRREVEVVDPRMPVNEMVEVSFRTHQMDLPVVEDGRFKGLVDRNTLSSALGLEGHAASDVMRKELPRLTEEDDLATAFRLFSNSRLKALPVIAPDREAEERRAAAKEGHVGPEGRTGSGKVSWARVPGERARGRLVGLINIEDMERAYLYITQQERVGRDTRIASPFDLTRKRRFPRAEGEVRRERAADAEDWVPVRRE